jgi:hypothetical protein
MPQSGTPHWKCTECGITRSEAYWSLEVRLIGTPSILRGIEAVARLADCHHRIPYLMADARELAYHLDQMEASQ